MANLWGSIHGMPNRLIPLERKFLDRCLIGDDCWQWTGQIDKQGYGRIMHRHNHNLLAHRVGWELLNGPIAEGMTIDHLCRNKACVNPSHMQLVTVAENLRRGWAADHRGLDTCRVCGSSDWGPQRNARQNTRRCRECHRRAEARRRAERSQI